MASPRSFSRPGGPTLAYDVHGAPDTPLVVLLHGLSGARSTYEPVIDRLREFVDRSEVQIANVDLRGHGDSTNGGPYDAATYASDIAALIASFGTATSALVVGHSLGGVVAATLAANEPSLVAGLFLEDPPLFEGDAARRNASPVASFFPKLVAAVRALHERDAPIDDYEVLARATTVPPSEVAERASSLSRWDPACMEAAVDGTVWTTYDPTVCLSCPVTLVRADPTISAVFLPSDVAPFLAANPHAEIAVVDGATHSIHAAETLDAYLAHLVPVIERFAAGHH